MNEKDFETRKKILELQQKISQWDKYYYDFDKPLVSDEIYDIEFNQLKRLELQYKHLFLKEELEQSPTNKINANVSKNFAKVKHDKSMLSLNKAYTIAEIQKFIDNIKKVTSHFSFFIEPKIDGLSISIKYNQGKLMQAVTRGNGLIGEDVTNNVLQIDNIPKIINYKKPLEVRGEIFLPIDEFKKINEKLLSENKTAMANPRNVAAGTLRQLDPQIVKERNLSSFLYYVVAPEKHNIQTMYESFEFLKKLGFCVTEQSILVSSIKEIEQFIEEFKTKKLLFNYETDGIVIKLNELKFYDKLGETAKFPHSAIAFKYEPDVVSTILKDIFITVGRTGLVTYNALLQEVELSGTKVCFATLNNYEFIKNLDINIGDEIYIKKSGEIIPCVIGLANKHNLEKLEPFKVCPYCNNVLLFNETGLEQYCLNQDCQEIKVRKLIHFASKEALDINSLGEKNIIYFYKNGFINNILDIFNLHKHRDELIKLERFGYLSINKILKSIEDIKTKPLENLIFGLSIPLVGKRTANIIASKILKLENALNFNFEVFRDFYDFGDKITKQLIEWFSNEENISLIKKLIEHGINPSYEQKAITNILNNKSFVITGKLTKPRSYFEKLIVENGGEVLSSISANIAYLLIGEKAGSKLSKAQKLGITIINEDDLKLMLNLSNS
ncbi:NAD-dependent DNA ligase LigA [Mycoplasma sp. 327]